MEKKSFWKRVFCSHPAYRNIKQEEEGKYRQTWAGRTTGTFTRWIITKQCVSCGHEFITTEEIWDR